MLKFRVGGFVKALLIFKFKIMHMDLFACVIEMLNLAIWNVKVFSLGNTWSCIHIYFFVVGESGNQLCLMYYSYVVNDIFDVNVMGSSNSQYMLIQS